ncbi:hypothetical protein M408DRAFT_30805 [Serendipita vermifera MAFF 305830]|uniref:Uncharacterized protein n=1 Tax=Serendipita vermifera MAFF 305830 TaxID=933852 RepID=A0A0C3AIN0_SERVB|nr:hypothetical protein M408DRAFT_30805 [Serendipita vermifera MAFF 305830]
MESLWVLEGEGEAGDGEEHAGDEKKKISRTTWQKMRYWSNLEPSLLSLSVPQYFPWFIKSKH